VIGPPPFRPPTLEYLGFRNGPDRREYLLSVKSLAGVQAYTIWIADAAFAARHVRFQDGPDVSYRKLQRVLQATEPTELRCLEVTESELHEYRTAQTPATRQSFAPKRP
jgi:hypothetical protein